MAANLVLTGFMGTGKSTVGRMVASRLGREFVDMDREIEAREGKTITEVFAESGEPHFRGLESEMLEELARREDLVIATGGGTLISGENRARLEHSIIICLDADAPEIARRLGQATDRPLLRGDASSAIARLLVERAEAYARIRLHVQTGGRSPEQVARTVIKMWLTEAGRLCELIVQSPDGPYPIWLGDGLAPQIGALLLDLTDSRRCAIVTNPTVARLHAATLLDGLRANGFDPLFLTIPDGERFKNLETLGGLYDQLAHAGLDRESLLIAFGGGVVGDVAGLAAATFLRGLPLVQVPTTLLAMVDASVGGKTAVDHAAGKNLIGAFKFPRAVVADPTFLATLPVEEYRSGLAEVVKHAVIADAGLFAALEAAPLDTDCLARALRVKIAIVERDPFEQNVRAHLNLGHTFGHALETLSGYRLRHGEAVAMGIACASRLATRRGMCSQSDADRIIGLLDRLGLPAHIPRTFAAGRMLEVMARDKKARAGHLRLVLPLAIGRVELVENIGEEEIGPALVASGACT